MPDGSYRYASWKDKSISDVPDLVIENGIYTSKYLDEKKYKEEKKWRFSNNGYFYELCCLYENGRLSNEYAAKKVVVKHNNRLLLTLTE